MSDNTAKVKGQNLDLGRLKWQRFVKQTAGEEKAALKVCRGTVGVQAED